MTVGYTFAITCPVCAGPVDHVAHSAPTPTTTRAVIHCDTCDRDGVITVTVSMAYKPNDTTVGQRAKAAEWKRGQRARRVNA